VLFISAEIEEVVRVRDRIMVLRDRAKAGELPRGATRKRVYLDDRGAAHERAHAHALFWPATRCAAAVVMRLFNPSFLGSPGGRAPVRQPGRHPESRRAAHVVSLGMTLVIAVRGLDISVGAVVPSPRRWRRS
jgi:hypothetical protein